MPDAPLPNDEPESGSTPYQDTELRYGHYLVVERLGSGGMGTVFLAEDTRLHRKVALKLPALSFGKDDTLRKRFYREARASARLDHPNICPIYDVGEVAGHPFLAMKYIKGQPLSQLVGPERTWEPGKAIPFVRAVAVALQHAHDEQVIHRDMKPGNIMETARGDPIVMDFGLAKILADDSIAHLTQGALGTPAYMSLEQWDNDDPRPSADVYALGVIFFQMLVGRTPFVGKPTKIMTQLASLPTPPLRQFRPELDEHLEGICLKAMAKLEDDRYASMNEFVAALERYPQALAEAAARSRSPSVPPPAEDSEIELGGDATPRGDDGIFETDFEIPPLADEPQMDPDDFGAADGLTDSDMQLPSVGEADTPPGEADTDLPANGPRRTHPGSPSAYEDADEEIDASNRSHDERMDSWLESQMALEFVRTNLKGWEPETWHDFVERVKTTRYWPLKVYRMEEHVRLIQQMEASRHQSAKEAKAKSRIKMKCPYCHRDVGVPDRSYFGRRVKCPKCRTSFTIVDPATL